MSFSVLSSSVDDWRLFLRRRLFFLSLDLSVADIHGRMLALDEINSASIIKESALVSYQERRLVDEPKSALQLEWLGRLVTNITHFVTVTKLDNSNLKPVAIALLVSRSLTPSSSPSPVMITILRNRGSLDVQVEAKIDRGDMHGPGFATSLACERKF